MTLLLSSSIHWITCDSGGELTLARVVAPADAFAVAGAPLTTMPSARRNAANAPAACPAGSAERGR